MPINPITRHLDITFLDSPEEAIGKGFVYRPPELKSIEVVQAVVVHNGTEAGNSTVDFILKDDTGQKFVFIITAALLKALVQ